VKRAKVKACSVEFTEVNERRWSDFTTLIAKPRTNADRAAVGKVGGRREHSGSGGQSVGGGQLIETPSGETKQAR